MELFPVQKDRRLYPLAQKIVEIQVYCYCHCPNNGERNIACDGECGEWFHAECVYSTVHRNKIWLCNNCVEQSHHICILHATFTSFRIRNHAHV